MESSLHLWKKLFYAIEMIRNYNTRENKLGPRREISMTQVQIIGCVLFSPDQKVRVRDIADELGITPGAVSQQVERLVKMDLLDRRSDENDRRAVAITLSESGMELNRKLEVFFCELFQRLLGDIPAEKLSVFAEVLDVMIQRMNLENQKIHANKMKGNKR